MNEVISGPLYLPYSHNVNEFVNKNKTGDYYQPNN